MKYFWDDDEKVSSIVMLFFRGPEGGKIFLIMLKSQNRDVYLPKNDSFKIMLLGSLECSRYDIEIILGDVEIVILASIIVQFFLKGPEGVK